jgi:hypothetical protein
MFIFAYIIPLFIMIYCNTKIYLEVIKTILFFTENYDLFHIYNRHVMFQNEI